MESIPGEKSVNSLAEQGFWPARALAEFESGDYDRAIEICRRHIEKQPHLLSGRVILARALYKMGQTEKAREEFSKILRDDPQHLVALKYLGDIHYSDGDTVGAMVYYRAVLEIDPGGSGLSCRLETGEKISTRSVTIKRGPEAAVSTKTKSRLEPAFVTETVGDIYLQQGHLELAGEVFRRLSKIDSSNRIADKLREVEEKLARKE